MPGVLKQHDVQATNSRKSSSGQQQRQRQQSQVAVSTGPSDVACQLYYAAKLQSSSIPF